ncbi:MAG: hypothetical protein ORN27_10960 [Rhodoluna sp.]|nr:hypothetical protein [Rhodoluna sp.]
MTSEKIFEDEDLSREIEEIPANIYDDGREIITRQITPKQKAPVSSQKGLSKRVLWTVVAIVVIGVAAIGVALALASSQTV